MPDILLSRALDGVATLTVSRPEKLNIVGRALLARLLEHLETLAADDTLRCVVLTGDGSRSFIGGADIAEMAGLDAASARSFITAQHRVCDAIRTLPVPVIARIQGYCLGAGLEIAASCDLRLAAADASFGMPEVRVGIPSVVEAALLPGLIGWGRTRRLLLLGERIDAATAHQWGLVEEVVPAADLDATVARWTGDILAAGPYAIRSQKWLIRSWEDLPLRAAVAAGVETFAHAFTTDEPHRMMAAFLAAKKR